MRKFIFICALLMAGNGWAEQWRFGEKIPVTNTVGEKIFHHLDSTGRNNLAYSGNTLALVWEDNHSGSGQVYIAYKRNDQEAFSQAKKLSNSTAAYSPVVISNGNGNFLVAWEQDNGIWCQQVSAESSSKALQISSQEDRQVSLTKLDKTTAIAVWVRQEKRFGRIMAAEIGLNSQGVPVTAGAANIVDRGHPKDEQLYPVIRRNAVGALVVWEDRRHGHTILLSSFTRDGKTFSEPVQINESVQKSTKYGRGSGVTRVAMTEYGLSGLAATWMDKRAFKTGYDIYAAVSKSGSTRFSKNMLVQDPFGDNLTQWNPAIAGNKQGDVVISWDDDRNETSDIWISWKNGDRWSDDYVVVPASEEKQQTNSVISFDDQRNLHIVWIEQAVEFGPTQIYYAMGNYSGTN